MLVIIVMAPTAISPPYLERLEVKLIERILSVDNMTNVEIPSARQGKIIFFSNLKFSFFKCKIVGICSCTESLYPEINGIGSVLHCGFKTLHISGRR